MLDPCPLLHNSILQLDTELVPSQCLEIFFSRAAVVVVEDVVKGYRHVSLVKITLHLSLGLAQISALAD